MGRLRSIGIAGLLMIQAVHAAVIHGSVRDANHRPLSAVKVYLDVNGSPVSTVDTDAQGRYRFEAVPGGTYALRAGEKDGGPSSGPISLGEQETKQVDLAYSPTPEFYDKPKFVVAGVAAGTYQGGHGSDVVLRSADELARATASLKNEPSAASIPGEAELHQKLGRKDEREGNHLEAVREYRRAAEVDPSETHLFDWGTELLEHRADDQAAEVFERIHRLYPNSVRALLGLGTAYYSRGLYDQAAKYFFQACDLNPREPTPYLFLGQVQSGSITGLEGFLTRIKRFAAVHPESARANYLYGTALWKRRDPAARNFLENALHLEPKLGVAYLGLGIVDFDLKLFPEAIAHFQKAIAADSALEEAHYRLAQSYRRIGNVANAEVEMKVYRELSKKSAEQAERQRNELQRFVFDLRQ